MSEQNDNTAAIPPAAEAQTTTVELDTPIHRGKERIEQITLIKPKAGALRGVAVTEVLQMDVNALIKLLPRITQPSLTDPEIRDMDPADFVQLGTSVAEFFLSKRLKGEI